MPLQFPYLPADKYGTEGKDFSVQSIVNSGPFGIEKVRMRSKILFIFYDFQFNIVRNKDSAENEYKIVQPYIGIIKFIINNKSRKCRQYPKNNIGYGKNKFPLKALLLITLINNSRIRRIQQYYQHSDKKTDNKQQKLLPDRR